MKLTVILFLLAQFLDWATTFIGIKWFGLWETNPIPFKFLLLFKVVVVVLIAIILQIKNPSRLDKWVVIASALVIPWNIFNIVMEI